MVHRLVCLASLALCADVFFARQPRVRDPEVLTRPGGARSASTVGVSCLLCNLVSSSATLLLRFCLDLQMVRAPELLAGPATCNMLLHAGSALIVNVACLAPLQRPCANHHHSCCHACFALCAVVLCVRQAGVRVPVRVPERQSAPAMWSKPDQPESWVSRFRYDASCRDLHSLILQALKLFDCPPSITIDSFDHG